MVDHPGMQKAVYNTAALYQMNVQKHAVFALVSKNLHHHKLSLLMTNIHVFYLQYVLGSTLLPIFYPVNLQHCTNKHVFSIRVERSVDPDQMIGQKPHYSVVKIK